MKFVGTNNIRLNRQTVEFAIREWLNEGRYSQPLAVKAFQRHIDGSMTVTFEPKSQADEALKRKLVEAAGIPTSNG